MKEEKVILVNTHDEPIGLMPKMEAHEKGLLHRAFSVFIFNSQGQLMLQQRAHHKYHSPGLWTNTCCSHQREGETNLEAATRRLEEEMGFVVPMEEIFSFIYKAPFDNGLTEHELDHVLIGNSDQSPVPNPEEVVAWKWMDMQAIEQDLKQNPAHYTAWFKLIFERVYTHLKKSHETSKS